jgi:hypothetical protein
MQAPQVSGNISDFKKQYTQVSPSGKSSKKNANQLKETYMNGQEPTLVCTEREIENSIEDEIRAGFFELKQKFHNDGPSSIYISHIVL